MFYEENKSSLLFVFTIQVLIYLFFQVFDLGEEAPDKVLHKLYANLEKLKSSGDDLAIKIENNLRLIVSEGERHHKDIILPS